MAEVVTGEAVVLDLTVARFPSRILALLLDVIVQLVIIFFVATVAFVAGARHLNGASAAAVFLSGLVGVLVGYPVIFETLSRGKTLGKLALGIRVVSDDGGPERFRQALIRALSLVFIEFWLPPFNVIGLPAGLITSMVSAKGKRLGDLFAGTFVIQERVPQRSDLAPAFTVVPPELAQWAQHLELSRLSDQTAAAASSYLRRFYQLVPAARAQIGFQLASAVAAQVSPPPPAGTPPAAFLGAVLAVRRGREQARLRARLGAQTQAQWQGARQPQPPAPAQAGPDVPGVPSGTIPYSGPVPLTKASADLTSGGGPPGSAGEGADGSPDQVVTEPDDTVTVGPPERPQGSGGEDYGFAAPF